jgi:hypothetical protein
MVFVYQGGETLKAKPVKVEQPKWQPEENRKYLINFFSFMGLGEVPPVSVQLPKILEKELNARGIKIDEESFSATVSGKVLKEILTNKKLDFSLEEQKAIMSAATRYADPSESTKTEGVAAAHRALREIGVDPSKPLKKAK